AGLGSIHDVLEGAGDEHLADARVPGRYARHLVQDSETAVDLVSGSPVLFDGPGEVLAEAGVEEVIIVPDLEAGFGEEVGEILLQVLIDALKTGPRVVVGRHFALLHFPRDPCGPHDCSAAPRAAPHSQRGAHVEVRRTSM